MALKTQKIVSDSGSQELAQLVKSYNALLDTMNTMIVALTAATDFDDDATGVVGIAKAAKATLEANSCKLSLKPNVPLSPAAPAA
jgi:hypothetical protein